MELLILIWVIGWLFATGIEGIALNHSMVGFIGAICTNLFVWPLTLGMYVAERDKER
jgi:hypothetical protein